MSMLTNLKVTDSQKLYLAKLEHDMEETVRRIIDNAAIAAEHGDQKPLNMLRAVCRMAEDPVPHFQSLLIIEMESRLLITKE